MCACHVVDGVPLPESRWRIIGSGNLQLSSIVADDTAVYVCTLHEASLTASASLVVYGMHLHTFEVYVLFATKHHCCSEPYNVIFSPSLLSCSL